jgi:hypothetical protein
MKKFILLITILTALFGSHAFALSSPKQELELAKDYFATNNFIFSSMYAEKSILTYDLQEAELNDLVMIFVESKKELGELAYASAFLKKNSSKISPDLIKNSESYLFEQDIYQNEFGSRLKKYLVLRKKDKLEDEDLKGMTYSSEIKQLDSEDGKKKPWVAATLSGIIPGAGQVYNGNYQSAAVSFIFNALLLFSAIEFHNQNLDWAAATSGFLFSMTYVGNIISSGRDAKSNNNLINTQRNNYLKRELMPELSLSFSF